MLNRAAVQPDPLIALRTVGRIPMAADAMRSPSTTCSCGSGGGADAPHRPGLMPTMAQAPTLGERGARPGPNGRGRRGAGTRRRRHSERGGAAGGGLPLGAGLAGGALRASGLRYPTTVPLWQTDKYGSRRSRGGSRASGRRWPGSSRRTATTTANVTGCALPTPSPTPATGRGCRREEHWRPGPPRRVRHRRLVQTMRLEPDPGRTVPARVPAVQEAAARAAAATDRGLARLSALADACGSRLSGIRGSRSRSGSRRPTPTAGCRRPGCRRRPSASGPGASGSRS